MLTEAPTKACSRCGETKPRKEFYPHRRMKSGLQSHCRQCAGVWRANNRDKVAEGNARFKTKNPAYHKDWWRKKTYGVTPEDVTRLRTSQGGRCAGCLTPLSAAKECVDHCHASGRVRGLLCNPCNVSLGALKENAGTFRRLAAYLEVF